MGKSQENFEDISIFSKDWSKQIIPDATIEHLDKSAIAIAREKYKEKMKRSHITEEVDNGKGMQSDRKGKNIFKINI